MSDPKGKIQVVKSRLNDYIVAAIGGIVSSNWKINITSLGTKPITSIKFDNISLNDETYGRLLPTAGSMCTYEFTLFVHDDADPTYRDTTPIFYKVMDDADDIITYLKGKDENDTEKSDYGIYRIFDIDTDFSIPGREPRDLGRMVIKGKILTKWLD